MPKVKTRPAKALRAKSPQSKTRNQTAGKPARASKTSAKSSRQKVSAHRKRMRAKGLRLIQM
jgi:hypothetical protein